MHINVSINLSNTKRREYSFSVSEGEFSDLIVGSQVVVNVNNQLKLGTVSSKHLITNFDFELKPILKIFKTKPLNDYQATLARAIFDNSISSLLDVQSLFINKISDNKININFYDQEKLVADFKTSKNKKQLLESDLTSEVVINYQEQLKTYMYVSCNPDNDSKLTEKQQIAYDVVYEYQTISIAKLIEISSVSRAVINTLIKNNVFLTTEKSKQFETLFTLDWHKQNELTSEQLYAASAVKPGLNLLYGVSSSGKTEVYIELAKKILAQNRQVLVIVPSVMLAVQVVGRFQRVFEDVIVYHSKLSEGTRASYRDQIEKQDARVIISTFDGLFLPFNNLGYVIFDEAHSFNYRVNKRINVDKQVIIDSLLTQNIDVLLGSATPAIGDYARALHSSANLITLSSRYGISELPEVSFVKPTEDVINPKLEELININMTRNVPTMIFFNKSGYAKQVLCKDCYHLHICPNCLKPLTYSKRGNCLECKYDGFKTSFANACKKCNSTNIKYIGIGIEQFTSSIEEKYPNLVIQLVDKNLKGDELYEVMNQFGEGNIDILIGTSTIAYGIDFLNVDTVYIANIDNLLTRGEVNSHEQAFNTIYQVAGRVGRNSKFSNAIIETDFESHFVMQAIKSHDYNQYYNQEMKLRKASHSYPYYYICKIEFSLDNLQKLINVTNKFKDKLKAAGLNVTNLEEPYLNIVYQKHRRYILINYRHEKIYEIIKQNINIIIENNIDYNIDLNNLEIGV